MQLIENMGLIHAAQMLRLGEVDFAICGGVSESIHTFGIFAGFKSQNALATHDDPAKASRPFDLARNGIVISEGGCLYTVERLEDAQRRGAKIYAEIAGWHVNSDASDYVLPNPVRQAECIRSALTRARLAVRDIHIVNTHATATPLGDIQECEAIRAVFGEGCPDTAINNTKSFIGHCMGAAGALELAGNLGVIIDGTVEVTAGEPGIPTFYGGFGIVWAEVFGPDLAKQKESNESHSQGEVASHGERGSCPPSLTCDVAARRAYELSGFMGSVACAWRQNVWFSRHQGPDELLPSSLKNQTMARPKNIVGPQVNRLRNERGWSQAQLAAKCQLAGWGVSRGIVAAIEGRVRWVGDFELVMLARVLRVDVRELLPAKFDPTMLRSE